MGRITGRGREVVDILERWSVEICFIQETRWRGNKAKPLGEGYNLIYSRSDARGRNGLGVTLNKRWQESVIEVIRVNHKIMKVNMVDNGMTISAISTNAPLTGSQAEEKEDFCRQIDRLTRTVPENKGNLLRGNLNGQIGEDNKNIQRVHGGWGTGE